MLVFRQSWPLLLTSFINKCGQIGLSLLPILLIDRQLSNEAASFVLASVKVAFLVGTFTGGLAADRLGLKWTILISFVLSGIGLGLLPFQTNTILIVVAGFTAQLGSAVFPSASRLMLTRMVSHSLQREAMGWLKSTNNLGGMFAFLLGWIFSALGTMPLMLFDAITAFIAAISGFFLLSKSTKQSESHLIRTEPKKMGSGKVPLLLIGVVLMATGFDFLYELYMLASPARFRLLFGESGLRIFSQVMVVNTVLCGLLGVVTARTLKSPEYVLPMGLFLTVLGCLISLGTNTSNSKIFIGVFLVTFGELMFTALSNFVLIRLIPDTGNQGTIYGIVNTVQVCGRILGAAVAFPLVIYSENPEIPILIAGSIFLTVSAFSYSGLKRVFS